MTDKPLVAVTGASSGIGEATARAFSAAGHPVLMMARRIDRMEVCVARQAPAKHKQAASATNIKFQIASP